MYPLPTFLCEMSAPRALNHPREAFTFSHSSPSCIAYNGVLITRCLVTKATETACTRSVEKNTCSDSLQMKDTYKDALLIIQNGVRKRRIYNFATVQFTPVQNFPQKSALTGLSGIVYNSFLTKQGIQSLFAQVTFFYTSAMQIYVRISVTRNCLSKHNNFFTQNYLIVG